MLKKIREEIGDEFREEVRKEFEKDWEKEKRKNPDCDPHSWWEERRLGMKIFLGTLMGIGGVGLLFLFGWIVMLLWNWLMPEIFGLGTVTYWQAWGLLVLTSILFKGFPSDKSDGGKRGDRRRKRELRHLMYEEDESGESGSESVLPPTEDSSDQVETGSEEDTDSGGNA